jgi:hypothetical protein
MGYGLFGLPDPLADCTRVFNVTSTASAITGWQTWNKPRGARLVTITCIGGGGAGGNGNSATASGGGGGGASGSIHTVIAAAWLIPDVLWVLPGGGALTNATGGANSYVAVSPTMPGSNTPGNALAVAQGGASGGTASGTTAGTAGSGQSAGSNYWQLWTVGVQSAFTGQGGTAGGNGTTPTAGTNITGTQGLAVSGGAGGGGCTATPANSAGGAINAPNPGYEPILTNIAGGAAGGSPGQPGISRLKAGAWPFYTTGGGGGGGNSAATGGAGGPGGIGSGGGGGGGGTTGGAGGPGGNGLVIITVI